MANLNISGNFSTSSDLVTVSYATDVENITNMELTKDNANFITANSFTSSNATFDVSSWDYGTYSCKLRMTHAQNPLTLIQYKQIGDNDEIVDTTDGQWWSIVTPHSVNANTSYTLSLNHVSYVYVCFYDTNGNYLNYVEGNTSDWSIGQLTFNFTTVANTAKILISVTGNDIQPTASISPNNSLVTISNNFNIIITENVTEPSEPSAPSTDPNTVIEITKAGVPLTPVSTTPTTGQYQVTITNTLNCTAILESDNKTITVTGASSNDGQIDIRVNIENKRIYTKSIAVANMLKTSIVSNKMSEVKQTADALTAKFTDGFNMGIIEQSVNGIKVYHNEIDGENYTHMSPTGFLIKYKGKDIFICNQDGLTYEGTITGSDINGGTIKGTEVIGGTLNVEGELTANVIVCQEIDSPRYPATLDGNVEIYVNSSTGNDDSEFDDDATFATLQGAIDAMPKFLNGKTVHITMESDCTEDVYLKGFVSGAIRIYMDGYILYGTLKSYVCSASITVYGGNRNNTEEYVGVIHPKVGLSFSSRAVSVGFEASQYVALYKVKVFAPDELPSNITNTDKACIAAQAGTGNVYCKNVEIVNAVVGFKANTGGRIHVSSSSGIASKYGFQALTGGIISLANNNQCGGNTANTNKSAGGQIWYDTDGPTFASGNQTIDTAPAPVTSTTKTMTIKSSYGDTYRSSVYDNWKKDGTARQGDYGYGDCTGCWFFGTAFSELKGKTISKVQITITRQSGGSYSAVGLAVRTHNYSARPSGAPTLSSSSYGTLSLATNTTGTLTITNSDVLNGISNGTIKGFGIRTTYDSAHYAVCSGSVTVKITYTE